MNLGEHPLALLRGSLGPDVLTSAQLNRAEDGSDVEVAGMVVARQRPETAKGITFMLLEDETGAVNLIVGRKVYERRRTDVRSAPLLRARGRLERREGTINVLVAELAALECGEERAQEAKERIQETARKPRPRPTARRRARELAVAELRAVAPAGHSFGRRGR